jgi:hypothetical protein
MNIREHVTEVYIFTNSIKGVEATNNMAMAQICLGPSSFFLICSKMPEGPPQWRPPYATLQQNGAPMKTQMLTGPLLEEGLKIASETVALIKVKLGSAAIRPGKIYHVKDGDACETEIVFGKLDEQLAADLAA